MHRVRDDGYEISDDRGRLDRAWVHWWLAERSYWALGRTREVQDRAIDRSLCFGVYSADGGQVGFCRYVTDAATFAWMCDVFVAEAHRGIGLGEWMVAASLEHPDIATVRRQVLITSSAHDLYTKFGFDSVLANDAHKWMIRLHDDRHSRTARSPSCETLREGARMVAMRHRVALTSLVVLLV